MDVAFVHGEQVHVGAHHFRDVAFRAVEPGDLICEALSIGDHSATAFVSLQRPIRFVGLLERLCHHADAVLVTAHLFQRFVVFLVGLIRFPSGLVHTTEVYDVLRVTVGAAHLVLHEFLRTFQIVQCGIALQQLLVVERRGLFAVKLLVIEDRLRVVALLEILRSELLIGSRLCERQRWCTHQEHEQE